MTSFAGGILSLSFSAGLVAVIAIAAGGAVAFWLRQNRSHTSRLRRTLIKQFPMRRAAIDAVVSAVNNALLFLVLFASGVLVAGALLLISFQFSTESPKGLGTQISIPVLEEWLQNNPKIHSPSDSQIGSVESAIDRQTKAIENLDRTLGERNALGPATVKFPERQAGSENWGAFWTIILAVLPIILALVVILLGWALVDYSIGCLVKSKETGKRYQFYAKVGAIVSSLTLISVKDLTLVKFDFGSRPKTSEAGSIEDKRTSLQEVSIIFPENRVQKTEIDCGFTDYDGTNAMRVASFPEGWVSPNDKISKGSDNASAFESISMQLDGIVQILKPSTGVRLAGAMLIGAAEKTRLKPYLADRHGANAGLALERAIWVKGELLKRGLVLKASEIVVLGSDPGNIRVLRTKATANEFSLDRAVQVCAFWEREQ